MRKSITVFGVAMITFFAGGIPLAWHIRHHRAHPPKLDDALIFQYLKDNAAARIALEGLQATREWSVAQIADSKLRALPEYGETDKADSALRSLPQYQLLQLATQATADDVTRAKKKCGDYGLKFDARGLPVCGDAKKK